MGTSGGKGAGKEVAGRNRTAKKRIERKGINKKYRMVMIGLFISFAVFAVLWYLIDYSMHNFEGGYAPGPRYEQAEINDPEIDRHFRKELVSQRAKLSALKNRYPDLQVYFTKPINEMSPDEVTMKLDSLNNILLRRNAKGLKPKRKKNIPDPVKSLEEKERIKTSRHLKTKMELEVKNIQK